MPTENLGQSMTDNKDETSLRQLVYHTDARVTAMEGSLSSLTDGQLRQEQKIDHLISNLNKPKDINWAGWAGLVLVVVLGAIGFTQRTQEFVALTLQPVNEEIAQNYVTVKEIQEDIIEFHKEVGIAQEFRKHNNETIQALADWMKDHGEAIIELKEESSRAKQDREAMSDRANDLDAYGSRRWIGIEKDNE